MIELDFEKTIFIVDSTTTALIVSIISNYRPIECIVESKDGVDTEEATNTVYKFLKLCTNIKKVEILNVPSPFFMEYSQWYTFKKKMSKIYKYKSDIVYVGSRTSSIMESLNVDTRNIVYLYHGLGDYIQPEESNYKRNHFRALIKGLYAKLIGLPVVDGGGFWAKYAFSMCKTNERNVEWINYEDFHCDRAELFLDKVPIDSSKRNVLFCPVAPVHSKSGVNPDTRLVDDINVKLVEKNVSTESRIFVKLHPMVYRMNREYIVDLICLLRDRGYDTYDLADYIDDEIGGKLLPAEVLCRYLPIDCVLAEDSSVAWNLSQNHRITKILDMSNMDEERRSKYLDIYNIMKLKTDCKKDMKII